MDLNGEVPRGPLDAFFMSRPRYIHLGTSGRLPLSPHPLLSSLSPSASRSLDNASHWQPSSYRSLLKVPVDMERVFKRCNFFSLSVSPFVRSGYDRHLPTYAASHYARLFRGSLFFGFKLFLTPIVRDFPSPIPLRHREIYYLSITFLA